MTSIVLVGEAWGREEAEASAPFIGASGKLLRAMLSQVGIRYDECFITNVFNFKPKGKYPDNDLKNVCGTKAEAIPLLPPLSAGKYVRAEFAPEIARLQAELAAEQPRLVIAFGATAAWALLGTSGIKKIRGAPALSGGRLFSSQPFKVLPTYHPAAVLREWSLRPIVIADLLKARREAESPELVRPSREIWIEPTISDLLDFEHSFILPSPDLSVDIETAGDQTTCVGFAPSVERAIVVPFVDPVRADGNYWRTAADELSAWNIVRRWCMMTVPISQRAPEWRHLPYKRGVGQNHLYDIHRLWRGMGIQLHAEDDTMLMHHAMQPEMEKGLGFLATIYTEELTWKFMRKKHETLKKED